MATYTTNLTVTTPRETTSATLSGDYTEVFSLSQKLDNNTSLVSILSNATAIGSLTLSDCKTLMIKNSGAVGAELNILLNGWSNAAPDTDTSAQYVSILLASGDFIMLPNLRVLGYQSSDSAGDAIQLDNLVPDANMYIAVDNPTGTSGGSGDPQLTAEAVNDSETDITVDDANFFYVGDLIRIENEIMEVTAISGDTLTVIRGAFGSTVGDYSDDKPIRFPFFNAYSNFTAATGGYDTAQTNGSGHFKAMNFFGYGRAELEVKGLVAGSISGKFYSAGYQELGMSGITSSTNSGLAASTEYGFDITVDGSGLVDSNSMRFTTSSNTKFGGSDGVIRKIQDVLDTLYYTSGNLLEEKVTVSIVNGDIRFTSGQRLSTSAILLATGSVGMDTAITPFGVGRIPAIGEIMKPILAKLPDDVVYDRITYATSPNAGALSYDDAYGNLVGGAITGGTINYETGAVDFRGPSNAEFVITALYNSPFSGKIKSKGGDAMEAINSLQAIHANTTNQKHKAKLRIELY